MPKKENWQDIRLLFTEEFVKEWQDNNFSYQETKNWMDIGLRVNDAYFASYLRDIKNYQPDWVFKNANDKLLRQEFQTWKINRLKELNTPNNNSNKNQTFLTTNQLLITAGLIITIYLLTTNYD